MNSFSKQGKALPNKVRNEIIERYIINESYTSVSRNLNLPYKTISNIVELWIETGSIEARTKKIHKRTARTDDSIAFIEYLKSEKPSMYGKKIQQELLRDNVCLPHNVPSLSSISRILKSDLGYSYKKMSPVARETERDDIMEKLENYVAMISAIDKTRLHFFDESSVLVTSGNRRRGHSAVGKPAIQVQRYASKATYTVNLLHNITGVSYFNILRGPSNGLELLNFFEEALEQEDAHENEIIKDNDVVVMDNCSFHHGNIEPHLRDTLAERNVQLVNQPPYHPCYNTCKACFHHMKTTLRIDILCTQRNTHNCVFRML